MGEMVKKIVVSGKVQGVGFRYSMCDEALKAKLKGYVKNKEDGSVEAVFQGPEEKVLRLIEWTKKGPGAAKVEKADITDTAGAFNEFEIRY